MLSHPRRGWQLTNQTLIFGLIFMKSAYELAMERLNKSTPAAKITAEKKKQLAELDSRYSAKIAEREIFVKAELAKAAQNSDHEAMEQIQKQLLSDRKTLRAELEEKKEAVRQLR